MLVMLVLLCSSWPSLPGLLTGCFGALQLRQQQRGSVAQTAADWLAGLWLWFPSSSLLIDCRCSRRQLPNAT